MRGQFPGYFTPNEEEFTKLWSDCVFGFDANVLLGLYRSTVETQEVFFSVLEKIVDRIYLPHQAASEYLKNRLNVISFRSEQYGKIKSESERLANAVESIVQEHAVLNGAEIAKTAKEFAKKICDVVDASVEKEPDLLHADDLLTRLAELFETSTGQPYPAEKLKEMYVQGAHRYAQGIPPGYKDDKKAEPGKYGDLLIWFQLLDHAKLKQKPIIFVTGDVKEDWLLQHRSETIGPRPELRQEMMATSGVSFWMYTTPRFLEFAKQFLGLKFDTKKAESEFEKIEKQDRRAAEINASVPPVTFSYNYAHTANQAWPDWNTSQFFTQPVNFQVSTDYDPYSAWTPAVDSPSKQKFLALLPINGSVYSASTGKWKCEITTYPSSDVDDRACYSLKFEPEDRIRQARNLKLWVSVTSLENDPDWRYKKAISGAILKWLGSNQSYGEIGLVA